MFTSPSHHHSPLRSVSARPGAWKFSVIAALAMTTFAAHAQTCLPPANGDWTAWLDKQEQAGGHTKACHLGVADSGLISRIVGDNTKGSDCNLSGGIASSWSDPASLTQAIKATITQNAKQFANGPAGTLVLEGRAGGTIGRLVSAYTDNKDLSKNREACAKNSSYSCTTTGKWKAILRKTATGSCYLLTAYPI